MPHNAIGDSVSWHVLYLIYRRAPVIGGGYLGARVPVLVYVSGRVGMRTVALPGTGCQQLLRIGRAGRAASPGLHYRGWKPADCTYRYKLTFI